MNTDPVEKIFSDIAQESVPPQRDITEDEEYQKFVESMVPYCHCSAQHRPCDGVLAGGLCDGITDDGPRDDEQWDDCE